MIMLHHVFSRILFPFEFTFKNILIFFSRIFVLFFFLSLSFSRRTKRTTIIFFFGRFSIYHDAFTVHLLHFRFPINIKSFHEGNVLKFKASNQCPISKMNSTGKLFCSVPSKSSVSFQRISRGHICNFWLSSQEFTGSHNGWLL